MPYAPTGVSCLDELITPELIAPTADGPNRLIAECPAIERRSAGPAVGCRLGEEAKLAAIPLVEQGG